MNQPLRIPLPADEAQRLAALHRYRLLDTPAEADFDFLTEMAAALCGTQFAFVSLVDENRVWFKSAHGSGAVQAPRDADYCSWAILEERGLYIPDLAGDPRTAGLPPTLGPPHYRMYCGANLVSSDGYRIGSLCVLDQQVRELDTATTHMLARLAHQVMSLIELRARSHELEQAYLAMQTLATIDELTGMLNRRALMARLREEVERCQRFGGALALVMVDLDHFKQVNDAYGHQAGDAVLAAVGALLRERIRITDSAGRYGGEELCLLLPGADAPAAALLAEKLRAAIAATVFPSPAQQVTLSASFGVAAYHPDHAPSPEKLVAAADRALYRAKHGGRNQVAVDAGA
ncbi:MAG: sensor domain-containing diguanylate cyclase [Pseudomonadota bacterium]